jgi:hypothetical protein
VDRAKGAGALDLAGRAEAHITTLMDQGRARWQTLDELGERFAAVERELQHLGGNPSGPASGAAAGAEAKPEAQTSGPDLEADWAAFENQQELDALRQKMQG